MGLTKNELIEKALRESKDFSKEIRRYLHEVREQRPLTEEEQRLYEMTHKIHVHTNDAILLLR